MSITLKTLTVNAVWGGGYRCEVATRQHRIMVDEPESAHGTDTGSTPTELFLASLGSCFILAVSHVAARRDIEISAIEVNVTGTYAGPLFTNVALDVRVVAGVSTAVIDDLLQRAQAVCYVSNTLAKAPPVTIRRAA